MCPSFGYRIGIGSIPLRVFVCLSCLATANLLLVNFEGIAVLHFELEGGGESAAVCSWGGMKSCAQ